MKLLNVISIVCYMLCLVFVFISNDKKYLKFMAIFSTVACLILLATEAVQ